MIGIRDSNPKQIIPTDLSWLGRQPENNNRTTQAIMQQRKQIGENFSEGCFILVGVERCQRACTHPANVFFSIYSLSSLQESAVSEADIGVPLPGQPLHRYSTSVLPQLIIHKAFFLESVALVKMELHL